MVTVMIIINKDETAGGRGVDREIRPDIIDVLTTCTLSICEGEGMPPLRAILKTWVEGRSKCLLEGIGERWACPWPEESHFSVRLSLPRQLTCDAIMTRS